MRHSFKFQKLIEKYRKLNFRLTDVSLLLIRNLLGNCGVTIIKKKKLKNNRQTYVRHYIIWLLDVIDMYKAYKFRIYPTSEQRILINKTFGCYRFVYNYFLGKCKENGVKSAYDMCKKLLELYADFPWLKEVDSCSLRCAIFNLEDAYKSFFAKRSLYPKFKCKEIRESYRTNCIRSAYKNKEYANIMLDLKKKKIKLPKLGEVEIRGYRNLEVIN